MHSTARTAYPIETTFTARSLADTREFAVRLVRTLAERERGRATATIIALSGDLGAGKTTLVQHIAATLGVEDYVTSPTFVLQQIYKLPEHAPWKRLVHIDAYRLEGGADMEALKWSTYATDPGNIICIEWPTQVPGAVPERAVWIDIAECDVPHPTPHATSSPTAPPADQSTTCRTFTYPETIHLLS
jgi:tRNA threonylcarbamoyladenosine biosynthesis protein TsaE